MGFFNKIALKGVMNPALQEKTKRAFEERDNIHPYWVMVVPYLRLFFQGIADDSNCKDLLKVLAQGNRENIRQVSKLLAFWFFYSLDRNVLRGSEDLLEDPKIKVYFKNVWYLSNGELQELTDLHDDVKIEERPLVLCKLICEELREEKLLTCLTVFASVHISGAQKLVLTLSPEDLAKLG